MRTIEQTILDRYRRTDSIKAVSREVGISEQSVRRVLIQHGAYTSQRAEQIGALWEAGKSVAEIAEELHITPKSVIVYLPYSRIPYISTEKTKNAMNIRAWRERVAAKNADRTD